MEYTLQYTLHHNRKLSRSLLRINENISAVTPELADTSDLGTQRRFCRVFSMSQSAQSPSIQHVPVSPVHQSRPVRATRSVSPFAFSLYTFSSYHSVSFKSRSFLSSSWEKHLSLYIFLLRSIKVAIQMMFTVKRSGTWYLEGLGSNQTE